MLEHVFCKRAPVPRLKILHTSGTRTFGAKQSNFPFGTDPLIVNISGPVSLSPEPTSGTAPPLCIWRLPSSPIDIITNMLYSEAIYWGIAHLSCSCFSSFHHHLRSNYINISSPTQQQDVRA